MNPTKTKRVNSIVPLIIFGLIAVIVLVASLLSQRPAAEAEEASRAETTAEATAKTEAGSAE